MVAQKSSSVDKQAVVLKLMKRLKKEFGGLPKREPLPVLETMIYAICLENSPYEAAQTAFDRIKTNFYDWNEVRVSTISELEPTFAGLEDGEWRAMRMRYLLHYVFDHQYSYDFDALKKKTLDLAQKQLAKIKHLTPFVRNYLLQNSLGNHIIPLDDSMCRVATWLGLLPVGSNEEEGADLLKSAVRKADGPEFTHQLKSLSVWPKAKIILETDFTKSDGSEFDLATAEERLEDVISGRAARRAAAASRQAAAEAQAKAAAKAKSKKVAAKEKPTKKGVSAKSVKKKS